MDKLSSLVPKVLQKRGLTDQAQASYIEFLVHEWVQQTFETQAEDLEISLSGEVLALESSDIALSTKLDCAAEDLRSALNVHDGVTISKLEIRRKN